MAKFTSHNYKTKAKLLYNGWHSRFCIGKIYFPKKVWFPEGEEVVANVTIKFRLPVAEGKHGTKDRQHQVRHRTRKIK